MIARTLSACSPFGTRCEITSLPSLYFAGLPILPEYYYDCSKDYPYCDREGVFDVGRVVVEVG